ncbi:Signal transduction histidine kinase [Limimonas halophila]|uniref:histidine kinase n=1 Tax=Limimonas halophila TaxID=1082479 RepID=A0A1G7QMJ2_9PROT|nr:ATP-binding protein [Limimonas halophila]SDF99129.1 Signal transduction histidine kinase [Limimonas halophila]
MSRPHPTLQRIVVTRLVAVGVIAVLLQIPLLLGFYLTDHEGLRRVGAEDLADRVVERARANGPGDGFPGGAVPAHAAAVLHWSDAPSGRGDDDLLAGVRRFAARSPGMPEGLIHLDLGDDPAWLAVRRTSTPHGPLVAYVGVEANEAELQFDALTQRALIDEAIEHVVLSILPVALVLIVVASLAMRRALRPLVRVARAAEELGESGLDSRLPADGLPREVASLVNAVNTGLARLERATARQRDFAAMAAHELRTPLTRLKLEVDHLTDPRARRLREQIDSLTRTANQLLALARAEALEAPVHERVDLSAVARRLVAEMAPIALDQGQELGLDAPDTPVTVNGDGDAIDMALRNLIENALAHVPEGGTVDVRVGPGARVTVADAGPGVPDAAKPEIFDRYRHRPGGGRRRGGVGLGLAIVAEVMAAHGGRAEVHDSDLGGAAFVLDFTAPAHAAEKT